MEDHIRAKHAKKTKNEQAKQKATPLDIFYQIYEKESGFKYNRASNPLAAFRALRRHMRWSDDDSNYEYAKLRYRAALNDELKVWFGSGDDLGSWHALCRAVGIAPLPRDGGGCQTALRGKQVNLVDLVEWARADGGEEETVRVFRDVSELRRYTRSTRRYFPLVDVESLGVGGDGDVVIRHLLRRINS